MNVQYDTKELEARIHAWLARNFNLAPHDNASKELKALISNSPLPAAAGSTAAVEEPKKTKSKE